MANLREIRESNKPIVGAYLTGGRRFRHATRVTFPDGVIVRLRERVLDEAEAIRRARVERATFDEWADVDARAALSAAQDAMERGCFF